METVVMGISGGLPGLKHIGKLVAKPSEALSFNYNLISSNRKPKRQHGKAASWGGGGGALEARNPGTTTRALQLPQIPSTNTVVMCNKNKKTFRKNPLGDLLLIICAG